MSAAGGDGDPREALVERARAMAGEAVAELGRAPDLEEEARAALRALGRAGLTAWTVPEAHGGAATGGLCGPDEVSARALCALRDELAWHHGVLDVMLVMQGLGSYPIARGGTDELRAQVLPAVARGEQVAAFALTEPDAGSDLSRVATRAERRGDRWVVSGRKTFISNVPLAHFYCVLARTSGEPGDDGGLSMLFVPADAWGVDLEPFEVMAPHPIGDLVLADVELPEGLLLGEEGRGLELALATLGRFRATVAAAANGFSRRALDASLAHLGAREQFGRPLSANQGLRFDLAEMDVRLRAAQLLVDEAAAAVDAGRDARREVARAKLYATEAASWICDRAVQHHGGLGVKRGTVVERLFREVRALRIYEGTSEVQRLLLARELLRRENA